MSLDKREEIEKREGAQLARYAAHANQSQGRMYPSSEHPFRTAFQRDRDRIIHTNAFRRMEFKTQVFLPHEGDHFRTRLTHTIEVAQISRTLARSLKLNEDLTEAIALVHDLGHTPFGHAGEDVLNELLKDIGGFNHNNQSLRVVDILEQRYAEHPGLNLTYEVREGIVKHETKMRVSRPEFEQHAYPTLEASLVDIADEIAYNAHDVDDGLRAKLIRINDLRPLAIAKESILGDGLLAQQNKHLSDDELQHDFVRNLVNLMATDVIEETDHQIEKFHINNLDEVYHAPEKVARFSSGVSEQVSGLKKFLREQIYRHDRLVGMCEQAKETIETLYGRFIVHPEKMPKRFQEMLLSERKEIVIADYIAGMTDRYAQKVFEGSA
jgi:dGTPase